MSIDRRYTVELTAGALQDLDDIVGYVAAHDAPAKAEALLERLLDTADTLRTAPQRGSVPRELQALGMLEYRQTMFKPYRLIYQVREGPKPVVVIVVIADGRRDMNALLQRRLLNPDAPAGNTDR